MQRLWQPSTARVQSANLTAFVDLVGRRHAFHAGSYADLYRWSIERPDEFWRSVWEFGEVRGEPGDVVLQDGERMPGARWFPNARLNFAENLLRRRDDSPAIVFRDETRVRRQLSWRELHDLVSRLAQALAAAGVGEGDRVAGLLPNLPEAIAAMLASASLGAIWSSTSPDFGVQGVLDRFSQIEPKVLITADGYHYGGKTFDVLPKASAIAGALPSLVRVVVVPYAAAETDLGALPLAVHLPEFIAPYAPREIEYRRLPFDHPLYILYSSGTTGVPKCIVHGAGGTLLQHLKEHRLHTDIRPGDRLFYFTTCGWMMWNWLASGLASEATLMLYDGSPFYPDGNVLWNHVEEDGIAVFGTSAKYLDTCAKHAISPAATYPMASLRTVLSTGSPLAPEGFDYVYERVKKDVCLSSISGGTDIVSCFALGCPTLPVLRGELQCRGLGMAVEVFDEDGHPLRGEKGELVCVRPFPSMPVAFWNDPDGARYQAAYFSRYPNVWHHGDWVELTGDDGLIIHGRSDSVLNPGGVRIGTAEIYRQAESLEEVVESLVIGQDWERDVRVVLFVRLRDGLTLDAALEERIRRRIRENTTARHVPGKILQVEDIPRTKSGKIVELAVRNVVHGLPVKNREALANPESLAYFRNRPELMAR